MFTSKVEKFFFVRLPPQFQFEKPSYFYNLWIKCWKLFRKLYFYHWQTKNFKCKTSAKFDQNCFEKKPKAFFSENYFVNFLIWQPPVVIYQKEKKKRDKNKSQNVYRPFKNRCWLKCVATVLHQRTKNCIHS